MRYNISHMRNTTDFVECEEVIKEVQNVQYPQLENVLIALVAEQWDVNCDWFRIEPIDLLADLGQALTYLVAEQQNLQQVGANFERVIKILQGGQPLSLERKRKFRANERP